MTTADMRYFALPDPTDSTVMVFFHLNRRGALVSWPPGTDFGPTLWRHPGPGREHVTPASLKGITRKLWIRDWHQRVRQPWIAEVAAAIDADPNTAAARFAALRTCCARCGRHLEDPASRARGLGSDCVSRFAPEYVAALTREVGRALGARNAGDHDGALIDCGTAYGDALDRAKDQEAAA